MLTRLRQLRSNATTWELVRFAIIAVMFPVIDLAMLVGRGDPKPLIGLVIGAGLPVLERRRITDRPEESSRLGRYLGYAIVGSTMILPLVRNKIDVPEGALLAGLSFALGLYVSFFVVLYSDPTIVRER